MINQKMHKHMKKIYGLLTLLAVIVFGSSCNDEWKDEQYEQYVSFKAPINNDGVSPIYVRYNSEGKTTYELPLIVSGSTNNTSERNVHIAVDSDTLKVLNFERFQNREDHYYKELESKFFSFPEMVTIKSGENTALMDIDFTLADIDMVDKWVLPLTIQDDPSYDYVSHPRKHYNNALLRIMPFNDYSGKYSGTALKVYMAGYENETPIVKSEIPSYVVDDNTIFIYAGNVDEERIDRGLYKIYFTFDENSGVRISSDNPEIDFKVNKDPSYVIMEQMDDVRPYLLHRYLTIHNIDYEFTDYTMVPNVKIRYKVQGSLIMERKINTEIPDKDQAIEWD